jgi:predicted transcriptional regulator
MPDLSDGNCSTGRAGLPPSAFDEDADPEDRELAINACSWCPVRGPCGAWVVSLPPRGGSRPRGVTGAVLRRPPARRAAARRAAAPAGLATAVTAVQAAAASTGANWQRQWQEAARNRARDALLRDPRRSNRTIAVAATVHRNTAGKVRRELEDAGLIGRWQDRLTPGRVHAAVTAALIRDAARTAMAVAEQTGANRSTVEQVRRELEAAGLIGRWRAPGYPRAGRRLS